MSISRFLFKGIILTNDNLAKKKLEQYKRIVFREMRLFKSFFDCHIENFGQFIFFGLKPP